MHEKLNKIIHKIHDHMLIGTIYDYIMMRVKYNDPTLSFLYNVMIAQKHRMLYYKKLKSKYMYKAIAKRPWESSVKIQNPNCVWVCWMQGQEQAPLLVRRCSESLKRNLPEKDIIFLDEKNLFEYITLPDYIIEKWKNGIIDMAQFTDLARLELLIKYGGYWIDATVLCTDGSLLKQIDETELFMYSFYYFGFNPEIMETNNWFIHSTTNQNILCLVQKLLYMYWEDYDRAVDYFVFHLFMTMALQYYQEEYRQMPIVSQADAHILATYIFESYDERKYNIAKSSTGFHKLSTRFNEENKKRRNTFYDIVIRQGRF